jgi:chromosome segregation protein
MYLKRLEVHGFKSFATRTIFDFGQGITAIVGPNGSGKSNIADALRWVLGEQSGRLLRARKMEDAIFAGSSKRSPADKAEVTLTLDNSDGWLPLDFSEVAITRRGYRNGESAYRINRKRVRLRDVQELLAKSSMAQGSYAIIGQGLVETVLNLRPEERRQLIEEAADIQRYRLRIDEARAKLAATHENVERINLLVQEIAPRLGHLERQAKRAADYARISRQLSQALQAYYGHQWHRAHEALAVSRATHDQAQAEFTQAKVATETCQRELAEVSKGVEERRRRAAASAADRQRLADRMRELEQGLAVSGQRRAILEARQQELRDEVAALEEERARAAEVVSGLDDRRAELEEALVGARAELDRRRGEMTALEEELAGGQGRAGDEEAKGQRLRAAAGDIGARIKRLGLTGRDLEKESGRLDTRRRSIISQMGELVRVLRGYRGDDAGLAEELAGVSHRRQSLESQIAELRDLLAKVEANQNARRGKLEALEARLNVLSETQRQLQVARADEPPVTVEGALAAIYQVVRVPRGLEQAIEAALSDMVEAFIVQHRAEAIDVIQALVAQDAPRTTLLPLDAIKHVYPLNLMRERGIIGVAAQLVRCQPPYQKLIDALLGRTIIVQDVEMAARVIRRGLGTVVTLDGIVFHPMGAITAGFPRAARPYILGHERDLESLPKEIDRVRRSLAVTENEVRSLRDRLRQDEEALAALATEVDRGLARRMRVQNAIADRQRRLGQLRGELRGLISSQDSLREQGESVARECERLAQERERSLAEAEELEESARYLRKAGKLVEERRVQLQRAVSEAAALPARLEGQLQSLDVQRESGKAILARLDAQLSAKAVQSRGLDMERSTLDSSARSDKEEVARVREELQPLVETSAPDQGETVQLELRERELHQQLLKGQGRMFQAERHLLEAEAEVRRWETEVDALRQHIEDEGLTITRDGDIVSPEIAVPRVPHWLAADPSTRSAGSEQASSGQDRPEEGPGGLRPISGGADVEPEVLGREIERLRGQMRRLGPVNVGAEEDYAELRERHDFLTSQLEDLSGAEHALHRAIHELHGVMRRRFQTTFEMVAQGFEEYFQAFFGGGRARLALRSGSGQAASDPEDPSTGSLAGQAGQAPSTSSGQALEHAGVEIEAEPPGKRLQSLAQLSGGEKALTAVSFLFALLQASPSPFCVLDEVDAMLDEANVGRFVSALEELASKTQFIVITHNRRTIEVSDSIYGVSMGPETVSRVLSLRLADVRAE